MGMAVMGIKRDLLVNAWYTGGVDVIDFTQPTRLKEIAYYDPVSQLGHLVRVPVHGPDVQDGPGYPGLRNGRRDQQRPSRRAWWCTGRSSRSPACRPGSDHLNPQTMD